jgi:hypothetical protein
MIFSDIIFEVTLKFLESVLDFDSCIPLGSLRFFFGEVGIGCGGVVETSGGCCEDGDAGGEYMDGWFVW